MAAGPHEDWGQWSPLRGALFPGTAIFVTASRQAERAGSTARSTASTTSSTGSTSDWSRTSALVGRPTPGAAAASRGRTACAWRRRARRYRSAPPPGGEALADGGRRRCRLPPSIFLVTPTPGRRRRHSGPGHWGLSAAGRSRLLTCSASRGVPDLTRWSRAERKPLRPTAARAGGRRARARRAMDDPLRDGRRVGDGLSPRPSECRRPLIDEFFARPERQRSAAGARRGRPHRIVTADRGRLSRGRHGRCRGGRRTVRSALSDVRALLGVPIDRRYDQPGGRALAPLSTPAPAGWSDGWRRPRSAPSAGATARPG